MAANDDPTDASAPKVNRRTRRGRKVIVFCVSLVLGLSTVEGILRLLRPHARDSFVVGARVEDERGKFCAYDPQLGWAGRPGVRDVVRSLDCTHEVIQNKYGFRGTEHSFERSAKRRVVILGDSFVWGYGVEERELFTSLVEESDPELEVVNLGVSGYGTDQAALLWQALGQRFRPDEVLLVVTPYTDLWENLEPMAYGRPKPRFRIDRSDGSIALTNVPVPSPPLQPDSHEVTPPLLHPVVRLAARSALIATCIHALARDEFLRMTLEAISVLPERHDGFAWEAALYAEPAGPEFELQWRLLLAIVERLRLQLDEERIGLRLLIVPSVVQVYPELWARFAERYPLSPGYHWNQEAPNARLRAYCERVQVPLIDPLPELRRVGRSSTNLYYPWNRHWTAPGHAVVADVVRRELDRDRAGRNSRDR